jgi:hypothetical protein
MNTQLYNCDYLFVYSENIKYQAIALTVAIYFFYKYRGLLISILAFEIVDLRYPCIPSSGLSNKKAAFQRNTSNSIEIPNCITMEECQ